MPAGGHGGWYRQTPRDPTYPRPAPLRTPAAPWCKACETQKPAFSALKPLALVSWPEVRDQGVRGAEDGLLAPPASAAPAGGGQFSVGIPGLWPHAPDLWVRRHGACSQVPDPFVSGHGSLDGRPRSPAWPHFSFITSAKPYFQRRPHSQVPRGNHPLHLWGHSSARNTQEWWQVINQDLLLASRARHGEGHGSHGSC